ncbi:MAG: FixH family protein [Polaribacter sp.]|nr:FixH family protein [Polaribacter sp.]
MRINWGTGIVLAFIGFIGFIMYFVITMSTDNNYKHDLVTKDYYKQELEYQKKIKGIENAKTLKEDIQIEKTSEGLRIYFPKNIEIKEIKGKVFLYRPSNKQLDFEMPIVLSDSSYLLMPDKRLLDGRWNIIVEWSIQQEHYLFKKEIYY